MSENNEFVSAFDKSSGDKGANGFGLESVDMTGWTGEGGTPSELNKLRNREKARFAELSGKAFGNPTINNAGVVLNSFGGAFGEAQTSPSKPNIQGGANK